MLIKSIDHQEFLHLHKYYICISQGGKNRKNTSEFLTGFEVIPIGLLTCWRRRPQLKTPATRVWAQDLAGEGGEWHWRETMTESCFWWLRTKTFLFFFFPIFYGVFNPLKNVMNVKKKFLEPYDTCFLLSLSFLHELLLAWNWGRSFFNKWR